MLFVRANTVLEIVDTEDFQENGAILIPSAGIICLL